MYLSCNSNDFFCFILLNFYPSQLRLGRHWRKIRRNAARANDEAWNFTAVTLARTLSHMKAIKGMYFECKKKWTKVSNRAFYTSQLLHQVNGEYKTNVWIRQCNVDTFDTQVVQFYITCSINMDPRKPWMCLLKMVTITIITKSWLNMCATRYS